MFKYLKKTTYCIGFFLLLFSLSSCQQNKEKTLYLFTWAEFFNPDLIKEFEEKYNCQVKIDYFDSNEGMYAKIKAGASHYDILTPSSYMTDIMLKQAMVLPLDYQKLPNSQFLDEKYMHLLTKDSVKFGVPITVSYAGIGYVSSRIDPPKSWTAFEIPFLKGRITLLNDLRETIGAALIFIGKDPNTINNSDLQKAKEIVIRWKKNAAKFDNDQYKIGLSSNEFLLCHGYSGDFAQAIVDRPDISFFVPKEGFLLSMEQLTISSQSQNQELAYAFINFLLKPKSSLRNMQHNRFLCPNTAAYLDLEKEENRSLVIQLSDQDLQHAHMIHDLGENNKLYTQIWDEIRFSP